jgi:aminoglycoside phosphotransferase (APT) family kinase protein
VHGYGAAVPEWDPDVVVDGALVRALLADQFSELDATSARLLGEGWDNSVWVVEEEWAFRFPRRAIAIPGVERELAVLPRLAPLLPVPIPEPRFVGRPSNRYPWPFFGALLLGGREPAEAELADQAREELGAELGRFLHIVHEVEIDAELPIDPNRRAEMSFRVPRARECLAQVDAAGIWRSPHRVRAILEAALRLPRSEAERVLHGDLHLRHILVEDRRVTAVIDWGDVCLGDPSIDLQLVWCLLPPAGRTRFVEAYGAIDDERLLRARATALYFCAMLASYAHSVGNANLLRESVAGLDRTLVDWD